MRETRVSVRYARSLLKLAIEKDELDSVYSDMKTIAEACHDSKELSLLLKSPLVKTDKKLSILKAVFEGQLGELSQSFMDLITRKKREGHLEAIAASFINQYKIHNRIKTAVVTTTLKLDDDLREGIMALVKGKDDNDVEILEEIDEDIIGGFIIRIGDQQIDATIKNKLNRMGRAFGNNS